MEIENFEDIWKAFSSIDISDESGGKKLAIFKSRKNFMGKPKEFVNFELYIKENLQNKIKIFDRENYLQIKKPIIVFFNHFRVKCAYNTFWLDSLYELALKYGERIEFLAADLVDIDIICPRRNIFELFGRPETREPDIYAIDERKRGYKLSQFKQNNILVSKTMENILSLCEDLLSGSLFPSLPIPDNNATTGLIKTCVSQNLEEMISNSTINIFLIICTRKALQYLPNYEHIALIFKHKGYNLDFVYIDSEKNYIPLKYLSKGYAHFVFIPYNNKNNYIFYEGKIFYSHIINYLENIMKHPEIIQQLYCEQVEKNIKVANDFEMDFENLPQFLQRKFKNKFQLLNKLEVGNQKLTSLLRKYFIIIFMDFSQKKCLAHHVDWLNKIYSIASTNLSDITFFVADFKDINVINSRWQPIDVKNSAQNKPKIYVIDHRRHSYEFGNFESAIDLAYFIEDIICERTYCSELYPRGNISRKVKIWTANYFHIFLKYCKKDIFITFYSSEDKEADRILNLLEEVAVKLSHLDIEIAQFDVKLNYVDLEYACESYPVHYFIPKYNKTRNIFFKDSNLSYDKIINFIKQTKSSYKF